MHVVLVCFLFLFLFLKIKIELEATMGDEDWEAEIIKPHMSSYVPVFEKVVTLKVCDD